MMTNPQEFLAYFTVDKSDIFAIVIVIGAIVGGIRMAILKKRMED